MVEPTEMRGRLASLIVVATAFLVLLFAACGPNEGILKSGRGASTPGQPAPPTSVERDVEDMRTASFDFIFVLRRRDGGPIDAEDRGVIRVRTAEANRRIASDDGKAFTIGSNRQIAPENMAELKARFVVEDYSPVPEQTAPANANKSP